MLIDGTKRNQEEQNPMIGGQPSSNITGTSNVGQTGSRGGTASGGFTNLNKYLQANQGANNQTINKLSNTAQQSAGQAQQAINQAKDVGTSAQQNLDQFQNDQQFVSQALANPLQAPDISRFNRLRTGFNASPAQQQQKFDTATAEANTVRSQKANELQNLTTSGGLTDWLRSQRQSPRYSQGSQSLDRFLIKGTDEGSQALQNIGQQAQSLQAEPDAFSNIRQGIQTRAQALDPNLMTASQIQNASAQRLAQKRQQMIDFQNRQSFVAGEEAPMVAGTYRGESALVPTSNRPIDRGGGLSEGGQMLQLQQYMRDNDTGEIVNRFTPEQVAAYTALAQMTGEDPTGTLSANEQAFNQRLAQQRAVEQQYVQNRATEQARAEAEAVERDRQAREAERNQRLLAIFAAMAGAQSTSGAGYSPPGLDWMQNINSGIG
jgi:hypothetical protein